jgi:hypothetical protein
MKVPAVKKFLTIPGVILLAISLSGCFFPGYGHRDHGGAGYGGGYNNRPPPPPPGYGGSGYHQGY